MGFFAYKSVFMADSASDFGNGPRRVRAIFPSRSMITVYGKAPILLPNPLETLMTSLPPTKEGRNQCGLPWNLYSLA